MGCGASTEEQSGHAPGLATKNAGNGLDLNSGNSQNELLIAPMARRMESKYPWEDMQPVPEDTTVVFMLGGPGSGKSTQCKKLVDLYGYTHLVTGDLLRKEVDSGTAIGKWASDLMSQGKLVPNQLSITLLKKAMISAAHPMVLVDGFPRSMDQVSLCERGICKPHAVLFFDVSEELARERRVGSGGSAENFHSVYETFREQSVPVKDHFVALGRCHMLDASQDPDVVFQKVQKIFEELEVTRKVELEKMAEADQARRDAEAAGEVEDEEEDANYDFAPAKVPAEEYNSQRGAPAGASPAAPEAGAAAANGGQANGHGDALKGQVEEGDLPTEELKEEVPPAGQRLHKSSAGDTQE